MVKRMFGALLVLALVVVFSTVTLAQQETKKEPAKTEPAKTEMKKDEMSKKEEMMGPMKAFDCGKECGFMVKSHDEKELMSMAKMHMKKHHNTEPSDKELKGMLKSEAPGEMKHH